MVNEMQPFAMNRTQTDNGWEIEHEVVRDDVRKAFRPNRVWTKQ